MRVLRIIILLLFFSSMELAFGQTIHLEFSGNVNSGKDSPLKNVLIHFIQNQDTICVTKTDETGKYACEFDVESREQLSIYASKYHYESKSINQLKISDTSFYSYSFDINFHLFRLCILKDPSIYYQKNESKEMDSIDLELLRYTLEEYPTIKLKFGQTIHPDESKRIARKRMDNFRKLLIENKIDIQNILFEETYFILDEKQLEKDPRPRILGIVVSL